MALLKSYYLGQLLKFVNFLRLKSIEVLSILLVIFTRLLFVCLGGRWPGYHNLLNLQINDCI